MADQTDAAPLVRMEAVSKVFVHDEVETHALQGVYLQIQRGEFLSIAGPSGCGKSTLLGIVGLLDVPTDGVYELEGERTSLLSPRRRAKLRSEKFGFIFQSFNLIGDLTVAGNVELPLQYRKFPGGERRDRVEAALERVGLAHRGRHYPYQLSGGQQQRVAVARAVVGEPEVLLADEPTGNLDSRNGESIMQLLADLHDSGTTVCMVTHDPRYTSYASRLMQLFDGRVAEELAEAG